MSLLRPSQIDPAAAATGDALVFDGTAWGPGAVAGSGGLPVVNVMDHGAVANGTTDDATAINNAIAALPTTGGIVYFPAGTYAIASTINLGNGTSTSVSTRHGIHLWGAAGPIVTGMASTAMSPTGYGAVRLKWTGASAGVMLSVNGPIVGGGLRNLLLDGQATAGYGVKVTSWQGGDSNNVAIKAINGYSLLSTAFADFSSLTCNTMHNTWRNLFISIPSAVTGISGLFGLFFDGTSSTNTCYDTYENVSIVIGTTPVGGTCQGVTFKTCDNVRIRGLHFATTSQSGTVQLLKFSYSGAIITQPADCKVEDVDFGAGGAGISSAATGGTPSGGINKVVNISSTNGGWALTSPGLTNIKWGYTASNP